MIDPLQGSGHSDDYKIPHHHHHHHNDPTPPLMPNDPNDNTTDNNKKIDPPPHVDKPINAKLHPLAGWFINHWGWPQEKALAAEKQFLKNIMHDCQHILNRYKNVYKRLNPNYVDD